MGYTHYWYRSPTVSKETWDQFVQDVQKILKTTNVPLANGVGDRGSEPVIKDDKILLNGIDRDSHETFYMSRLMEKHSIGDENRLFGFTKTARKPYDEVVTACLLAAKDAFKDDIDISSDGDWDDWEAGQKLYQKALGRTPKCPWARYESDP